MKQLIYLLAGAALLGAMFAGPAGAAPAAQDTSFILPPGAADLVGDGRWLAWSYSYRPEGRPDERMAIAGLEIAGGRRIAVAEDLPTSSLEIGIGDGTLAYRSWDAEAQEAVVVARRLEDGFQRELGRGPGLNSPAVFGDMVYWWAQPGGRYQARLYAASLGGGPVRLLADTAYTPLPMGGMRAGAGWLAWARATRTAGPITCYNLEAMPGAGGDMRTVDDLGCGPPHFDLRAGQLIYIDRDGMLARHDLGSSATWRSGPYCAPFPLPDGATISCGGMGGFASDGRYAFWARLRGTDLSAGYAFWIADTASGTNMMMPSGATAGEDSPLPRTSIAGGTLAWLAWPAPGRAELHLLPVDSVAPQGARCFAETAFCISGALRDYWEQNGGLPVFGYPIGPPGVETIEGSWSGPTQWFERDRLEDHRNEGKGVLAGRLGARYLELAGRPWQRGGEQPPAPAGCLIAVDTGYTLCEPFLSYWRANGGLMRFGYPIGPPQQEQIEGQAYTVQYFERRRMELHPEHAGTPYAIQLGLLGNMIAGAGRPSP